MRPLLCRLTFSDLISRARSGDREALGALFHAHQHRLLRYFRGLWARSPEDLASQVWVDVATGLGRFEGDEIDFRRWLFTIARRRHIDSLRRDARKPVQLDGDIASLCGADDAAEQWFETKHSLERALQLLRSLPHDMAEAVLLRVVADLDVSDVATIMGTSEGNVRVLVHRGLARLRSRFVVTGDAVGSISRVT